MSISAEAIPNHYIAVFKSSVPEDKCDSHRQWAHNCHISKRGTQVGTASTDPHEPSGVKNTFNISSLRGYTGSFDEDTKKEIEESDEIEFLEPDYKVHTCRTVTEQNALSWGLARLSHKEKLDSTTQKIYEYDSSAGEGVRAYIIDTGILAEHKDFEGRATFGYNAVPGSSNTDKNGHGTHCAGTIGSKTYGVAKKAQLIGVKVLDDSGSGSNSGVIAGLQWAAENADADGFLNKSVISMSLGGGKSAVLNRAVAAVVEKGIVVCVAAGNESADASLSSPASEKSCITVGATTIGDSMSSFSNYGTLVDILAPGSNITSTWIGSPTSTNTISGTSMATPHVSGLSAYLITKYKLKGTKEVMAKLKELGNKGQITGIKGQTTNLLAYNGIEANTEEDPTEL